MMNLRFFEENHKNLLTFTIRSLITSPPRISPATDGTKEILPGMALLSVHLWVDPGGQTQPVRQLFSIFSRGFTEGSVEYTTFNFFTPRFFSSLRMTFARGHMVVL